VNAVELFAGSGGLAEGLRRAGVRVGLALDVDPDACASYEANLGQRPICLNVRDLLRMARARWRPPRGLDLLVADLPGAAWLHAGMTEGRGDGHDELDATVQLIRVLRPRAYLITSVPGLDEDPHRPVVQATIGSLARDGYCVTDFARLDAVDYGVPQYRVRPFWYGHLFGSCVRWPARTHASHEECLTGTIPGVEPLRPYVTCGDALRHVPPGELGVPVRLRARHVDGAPQDGPCSDGALLVHPRHPINRVDEPSFAVTARGSGRGAQGASVVEWPWDRPVTMWATPEALPTGCLPGSRSVLSQDAIKLSETAAALLQGFPESWVFAGRTKRSRWSQIGHGVPPLLAEAVGKSLVAALGHERAMPGRRSAYAHSVWSSEAAP